MAMTLVFSYLYSFVLLLILQVGVHSPISWIEAPTSSADLPDYQLAELSLGLTFSRHASHL